ncbi:hypothetical protein AX769_15845 [Frondihabitans sp. PAMC 28766]|uniref:glycoside hydrolase family 16 protein n=1 Tax=Frondihabitans sp. PAMC 28766 TaxID=1795630 RepID=UPI00078E6F0F|nr:glycoside hydrolase family 16 protein [Frondihabitans sp. PAMC 28766]AMM21333.1 hypothetical protein AX769_15845 [Frondihabitans sp. PAMC 28766]
MPLSRPGRDRSDPNSARRDDQPIRRAAVHRRSTFEPTPGHAQPRSRRAFLGILGGAGLVVGGGAFAVFGPFSEGAGAWLTGGPSASPSCRILGPPSSSTPSSSSTPTPSESAVPTETPSPGADAEPTPTETAPVAPAAGAMPVGDVTSSGTRWTQTYSQDFTTDAATGRVLSTYPAMGAYASGKDTSGYGEYAPDQVLSVHDSVLDYHLRTVAGQPLVASVLPDDYRPHQYARVSIRYRATSTLGYKFVGMLWPSSNDWDDGEIDWPEGDLDARARPASQVVGGTNPVTGEHIFEPAYQFFPPADQTQFHVATTEWTKGVVRFFWDGKLLAQVAQGVPTKPMRVTLQAETWLQRGAPPAGADGHVEIDWVVVYEPA